MKVVTCSKCQEEFAIDLDCPDQWYCPHCDKLFCEQVMIDKDVYDAMLKKIRRQRSQNVSMKEALKKLADPFRKNVQYKKEAGEVLATLGELGDEE